MIDNYVVVIRRIRGDDVVGVIVKDNDDFVRLEHPYVVEYEHLSGMIIMIPYCPLTDETCFDFPRDQIEFVATASSLVTNKYVELVSRSDRYKKQAETHSKTKSPESSVQSLPDPESLIVVDGNNTKH